MGQRSQIYVRYNGKLILARYYQWNYAERMISRARYGIEYLKYHLDEGFDFAFRDPHYIELFARYFDVNFDMQDVVISTNIFKEWEEYGDMWSHNFFDCVFAGQDNNDGQLFIDITCEKKDIGSSYSIKYAFFDSGTDYNRIMNAEQYMEWDTYNPPHNWREPTEYFSKEDIEICEANIQKINEMAQLMTRADVNSFLDTEEYFGMPVPF